MENVGKKLQCFFASVAPACSLNQPSSLEYLSYSLSLFFPCIAFHPLRRYPGSKFSVYPHILSQPEEYVKNIFVIPRLPMGYGCFDAIFKQMCTVTAAWSTLVPGVFHIFLYCHIYVYDRWP